jgi:hypothetical protein
MTKRTGKPAIGTQLGRWTVIGTSSLGTAKHPKLLCRCACGNQRDVDAGHLKHGRSTSCGCVNPGSRCVGWINDTPPAAYKVWIGIRERCSNPNQISYPWYGGKGVRVCELWAHSFEAFYADMGERPSKNHWIERLDNARGYEPGNCVWATPTEQARNTARNRRTSDGRLISDVAKELGFKPGTVLDRVRRGDPEARWFRPLR